LRELERCKEKLGPASRCEDEIGTLTPGHEASFIVLDKDPSVDIRDKETIVAVWKAGSR
jgi:imidazolonepropionase-like amidohydrolase